MHTNAVEAIHLSLLKLQQKIALEIKNQQNDIVYDEEDIRSLYLHILLCWCLRSSPPPPPEQPKGRFQLQLQYQQRLCSQSQAIY